MIIYISSFLYHAIDKSCKIGWNRKMQLNDLLEVDGVFSIIGHCIAADKVYVILKKESQKEKNEASF